MNIQQLHYVVAIVQGGLNVSVAARRMSTSQPAISKQVRLLESELGFEIFVRQGRSIAAITEPGRQVLQHARTVLQELQSMKRLGSDYTQQEGGVLSIGTTHTQARYVLPPVVREFRREFPHVQLQLHQGTIEQIVALIKAGRVDLAMASGTPQQFVGCVPLPCYRWNFKVVVRRDHPLAVGANRKLTLRQLGRYPLITYTPSNYGPGMWVDAFRREEVQLDQMLSASDADVIKTYVRAGIGAGIIADVAIEPALDRDLEILDASHLFPTQTTWIAFGRGLLLRRFVLEFIQLNAPHLTPQLIESAALALTAQALQDLWKSVLVPERGADSPEARG